MTTKKRLRMLLFIGLSCWVSLWAQNLGKLRGSIQSKDGKAIPNAAVTIKNSVTGASQSVLTGPDGKFTVSNLPQGVYRMEVESQGFKRTAIEVIEVQSDTGPLVEVALEPGDTSQSVDIKGYASPLQAQSADAARAYDGEFLRGLPLLDRSQQQGIELMPGITPPVTLSAAVDPQNNRVWQANGMPANSNFHGSDGVETDDVVMKIESHVPSLEGVEQFNVITSDYDARRGRAGGSHVETLTQRGSNAWHGSLFEFNSNAYLQARNFFDTKPNPQGGYNLNQFGASVGGPVVHDKTFFFGSWEGRFQRQQIASLSSVPTAAMRGGDFSGVPGVTLFDPSTGFPNGVGRQQFTGNLIPASRLDPVAQGLLAGIPLPNLPGNEANFLSNTPFQNDSQRFDARIDHHLSDRTTLFTRYGYTNALGTQESPLGPEGSNLRGHLRSDIAVVGGSHSFNPSLVTDLRIGYNRYDSTIANDSSVPAAPLGIVNLNGGTLGNGSIPFLQIAGMDSLGQYPSYPTRNTEGSFNLVNAWSKTWNRHTLSWGADIWWTRFDGFQNSAFGTQGAFLFTPGVTGAPGSLLGPGNFANSFASFLLGAATQSGISGPTVRPSNLTTTVAGYVSDTIQLTSKLNVNVGLRYDFFTPFQPRQSAGVSIFDPATNSLLPINTNGIDARGNVTYQTRNFAPRVGFAYRLGSRTVLRGGYGISYWNAPAQFAAASFITSNPGIQSGVNGVYSAGTPLDMIAALPALPAGATTAPNAPLSFMNQSLPTPYVQNFSFMVQHDLGHGMVADVAFVGALGRHLPSTTELNAALPGTGVAGLPFNQEFGRLAGVLEQGTDLTSNYNALQVNLTRRFSHGLSLAAGYTYSRAFDFGNGLQPFLNNVDLRSNYGPSDFDRTQTVTISHTWALPFGSGTRLLSQGWKSHLVSSWSLNGVFRYASGLPFTPTASSAICDCPGNTGRADLIGAGFAEPAFGQFGNAGRNVARGLGFTNYDLAVTRQISLIDRMRIELRGEAYNIANSAHLALPVFNVNSAAFGQSLSTTPGLGARTIQFAIRATF